MNTAALLRSIPVLERRPGRGKVSQCSQLWGLQRAVHVVATTGARFTWCDLFSSLDSDLPCPWCLPWGCAQEARDKCLLLNQQMSNNNATSQTLKDFYTVKSVDTIFNNTEFGISTAVLLDIYLPSSTHFKSQVSPLIQKTFCKEVQDSGHI